MHNFKHSRRFHRVTQPLNQPPPPNFRDQKLHNVRCCFNPTSENTCALAFLFRSMISLNVFLSFSTYCSRYRPFFIQRVSLCNISRLSLRFRMRCMGCENKLFQSQLCASIYCCVNITILLLDRQPNTKFHSKKLPKKMSPRLVFDLTNLSGFAEIKKGFSGMKIQIFFSFAPFFHVSIIS